jgi:glutamyl-tRNA synthetase
MADPVVTRFAPSPTGFLHIGGARTALFNWLYAMGRGGKFLLRIEDTDRARSTPEAIEAILDGLTWLELQWEGEPVYQFARAGRHRDIAQELLARGQAYRCYLTPKDLEDMRAKAAAEGRPPRIESPWRDRDPKDAPAGVTPAIRLKAPRDGETVVADEVQGRVVFPNKDLDDLVIVRSDGAPTYNLSVVVDDHDMGITHVIRGDDHLTNAGRQTLIYRAMDWPVPVFAHVPLIHGPDGAKLSKRHGALGVDAYRAMGYLPVAMRNYLVRLGWSHGNDEIMSTDDLIRWFDLPAIGRSPARFDFAKLESLNGHYIRQTTSDGLLAAIRAAYPEMLRNNPDLPKLASEADWERVGAALPSLRERAKTLVELVKGTAFLFTPRPLVIEPAAAKLLDTDGRKAIAGLLPVLTAAPSWQAEALEAEVRRFADAHNLKLGKIAQPLRAALTGSNVSPPIFDVLQLLGRDEALARLQDQSQP